MDFVMPKSISIKQPWAFFIVNGYKPVENRVWKNDHKGVLLIHASSKFDVDWKSKLSNSIYNQALSIISQKIIGGKGCINWNLGCCIGAVVQTGVDTLHDSGWCINNCYYHRYILPITFQKPIKTTGFLKHYKTRFSFDDMCDADKYKLFNLLYYSFDIGLQKKDYCNV